MNSIQIRRYINVPLVVDEQLPDMLGDCMVLVGGGHWLAVHVDGSDSGRRSINVLDTLCTDWPEWLRVSLRSQNLPVHTNRRPIQKQASRQCAMFCIVFLKMKITVSKFELFFNNNTDPDSTMLHLFLKLSK